MSNLMLETRASVARSAARTRVPGWLVALCGAALTLAFHALASTMGVFSILGLSGAYVRPIMMLLGGAIAVSRFGSVLWLLTGVVATIACVVSYTPIVSPLVPHFIRTDVDVGSGARAYTDSTEKLDAVAVLSGSMTDQGLVNDAAIDRLLSGIAEAKRRGIDNLLLSVVVRNDPASGPSALITSQKDQQALVDLIAPKITVTFAYNVQSTRDEAVDFASIAGKNGWEKVLLVTSPSHTRRACATVEKAGLAVKCMPSNARDYSISRLDMPSNRRRAFSDVLYESAAILLYRARGWM